MVSTNASYSFTVTGNRTLVAHFTALTYTITATADPTTGGTVTGGGTFNYGQSCTLVATPATGHDFINWTKNGQQVSTNTTYTFTVTESATYVAHFQIQTFTVNLTANPTEGGILTGGGTYNYGQSIQIYATANPGYNFLNWMEDGVVVTTDPHHFIDVYSDRNLVANFEVQTFDVKVSIEPAEAATVTGEGNYNYGDEVTLTLLRNEDYRFVNWTEDGEVVSEEMVYVFNITSDRNLVANFVFTEDLGENSISAKVYPNPAKGEVTLEGEGLNHVRIVNAFGQTVYNADLDSDQVRIDLSGFAKGIYMMHIEAQGGQAVKKIVVE